MKKIIILILASVLAFSCNKSDMVKIKGKIDVSVMNGSNAFLVKGKNVKFPHSGAYQTIYEKIDSTNIDKNGYFSFDVPKDTAIYYIDSDCFKAFPVIIYGKNDISVSVEPDKFAVSGTKINEDLCSIINKTRNIQKEIDAVDIEYQNGISGSKNISDDFVNYIKTKQDSIQNNINEIVEQYKNANKNLAGGYFITFSTAIKDGNDNFKFIHEYREELFSYNYEKSKGKIDVGNNFVDLTMPGKDGNVVTLSDIVSKNKYVVLDFWSTMCGPCCKEMPEIAALYKTYKTKGVEFVSVSLDNSKAQWLKSIERLNMTWVQMCDFSGWKTKAANLYGVSGIPQILLIDNNGKIIAKNLRANTLKEKLEKLLD